MVFILHLYVLYLNFQSLFICDRNNNIDREIGKIVNDGECFQSLREECILGVELDRPRPWFSELINKINFCSLCV